MRNKLIVTVQNFAVQYFAVLFFGGGQEKDLGMSDKQFTSNISNLEPRIEIVSDTKNQRKKNMLSEIRFNEKEVLRDDLFTARSKTFGRVGCNAKRMCLIGK